MNSKLNKCQRRCWIFGSMCLKCSWCPTMLSSKLWAPSQSRFALKLWANLCFRCCKKACVCSNDIRSSHRNRCGTHSVSMFLNRHHILSFAALAAASVSAPDLKTCLLFRFKNAINTRFTKKGPCGNTVAVRLTSWAHMGNESYLCEYRILLLRRNNRVFTKNTTQNRALECFNMLRRDLRFHDVSYDKLLMIVQNVSPILYVHTHGDRQDDYNCADFGLVEFKMFASRQRNEQNNATRQ